MVKNVNGQGKPEVKRIAKRKRELTEDVKKLADIKVSKAEKRMKVAQKVDRREERVPFNDKVADEGFGQGMKKVTGMLMRLASL